MSRQLHRITAPLLAAVAFALLLGPAVEQASASHAGLMTLRGKVTMNGYAQPGAKVYEHYWNGSSESIVRSATADSNGNYAIVAGRNHWFYLHGVRTVGSQCGPYGAGIWRWDGYTNWFQTSTSWANPTYINVALTSGGRLC